MTQKYQKVSQVEVAYLEEEEEEDFLRPEFQPKARKEKSLTCSICEIVLLVAIILMMWLIPSPFKHDSGAELTEAKKKLVQSSKLIKEMEDHLEVLMSQQISDEDVSGAKTETKIEPNKDRDQPIQHGEKIAAKTEFTQAENIKPVSKYVYTCEYKLWAVNWNMTRDVYMKYKNDYVKNFIFKQEYNAYIPEDFQLGDNLWMTEQFTLANFMYDKFVSSDCITSNVMEADIIFVPIFPFTTWWKETPKYATGREAIDVVSDLLPDAILHDRPESKRPMIITVFPLSVYENRDKRGTKRTPTGTYFKATMAYLHSLNTALSRTHVFMFETQAWEGEKWDIKKVCHSNSHAIPYPSNSHPHMPWKKVERDNSGSYAFICVFSEDLRNDDDITQEMRQLSVDLRHSLNVQCKQSQHCISAGNPPRTDLIMMKNRVKKYMNVYRKTKFCLQPPGDTSTRKGIFDSLSMGCVPILFYEWQAHQYLYLYPDLRDILIPVIPPESEHDRTLHWILENEHDMRFQKARQLAVKWGQRITYSQQPLLGVNCEDMPTHCDAFDSAIWKTLQDHKTNKFPFSVGPDCKSISQFPDRPDNWDLPPKGVTPKKPSTPETKKPPPKIKEPLTETVKLTASTTTIVPKTSSEDLAPSQESPAKGARYTFCWENADTKEGRDDACGEGLYCARAGMDDRKWGGCIEEGIPGPPFNNHCCDRPKGISAAKVAAFAKSQRTGESEGKATGNGDGKATEKDTGKPPVAGDAAQKDASQSDKEAASGMNLKDAFEMFKAGALTSEEFKQIKGSLLKSKA